MQFQPICDKLKIVNESELGRIELRFLCNDWQLSSKPLVILPDLRPTWNGSFARCGLQPVADMPNGLGRASVMRLDVLAANI